MNQNDKRRSSLSWPDSRCRAQRPAASLSRVSVQLRQWHRARRSLVQTLQLDLPCDAVVGQHEVSVSGDKPAERLRNVAIAPKTGVYFVHV